MEAKRAKAVWKRNLADCCMRLVNDEHTDDLLRDFRPHILV